MQASIFHLDLIKLPDLDKSLTCNPGCEVSTRDKKFQFLGSKYDQKVEKAMKALQCVQGPGVVQTEDIEKLLNNEKIIRSVELN